MSNLNLEEYNLENWYNKLKNVDFLDIYNNKYSSVQNYKLIEISKDDIINFQKDNTFSEIIKQEIMSILELDSNYFFRLNTRSPKDVLEYNTDIEIFDDDCREVKLNKKIKQLEILKITNYQDVIYLINKSKRLQEDIQDFVDNKFNKLYLVFSKWNQILGNYVEYRCCIVNSKPTAICLFKPEYYSRYTNIPVEIILIYLYQLIKKINLDNFVADVYIKNNRAYLIEINPLCEDTNLFNLDYEDVINSDNLIVTL